MSVGKLELSRAILWNATLLIYLVGPGPLLGYDAQGNPLYEGTPVHAVAGYFGLALGVPVYSGVSYLILRFVEPRRKTSGGLTSAYS